ncbi:hypothetical protein BDV12DRAFT_185346 [Aspergillus spectabilis]
MSTPVKLQNASLTLETFSLPPGNQRNLGPPHPPNTVGNGENDKEQPTLSQAIGVIKQLVATGEIESLLTTHTALLFRGLPIQNASDFSAFSHAFGFKAHRIVGGVVDRPLLAPDVAPANEADKSVTISNHNENHPLPHAPTYLFFFAERAPKSRGETLIASSAEIYHRGVKHTLHYYPITQFTGGVSIEIAFGKDFVPGDDEATKRQKVESQILKYNRGAHTTWIWHPSGQLTVQHTLPEIRVHPPTRFPNRDVATYGDGDVIPEAYLETLLRVSEEVRVLHRWGAGDVLVYDNRVAQHGREPWDGEQEDRKVLES